MKSENTTGVFIYLLYGGLFKAFIWDILTENLNAVIFHQKLLQNEKNVYFSQIKRAELVKLHARFKVSLGGHVMQLCVQPVRTYTG